MSRAHIAAVFRSSEQAQRARDKLTDQHVEAAVHAGAGTNVSGAVLTVFVEQSRYDQVRDDLITAGAEDVSVIGQHDSGWYGHNDGRITGAGVTPGAGDSEAGTDTAQPRRI